jgi:flagellar biosynthetic protein FlhB
MSAAEQDLDRSEAATPFKLQKAREQGQTARSVDLVSGAVFMAAMLYLSWQGHAVAQDFVRLAGAAWMRIGDVKAPGLGAWAGQLLGQSALLLLPLFVAMAIAAVGAAVAQTGFVFSVIPLEADLNRINPSTGLKRVFSLRTLFDGARACVKLVVLSTAAVLALQALLPQFHAITALPPEAFLATLVDDLASLGLRMALALLLVGAVDLVYTRREFGQNMRMSRRELTEEFRNREGDPRIRGRMRELRRELLKRSQSLGNTRTADVVLTNPTHYAVALRYVHGEMPAPRVVAKGAGELAAAMRGIAARHGIVVVQNPPLARRLFREAPLDQEIPSSFHGEVARIIVWVLAIRRSRAAATGATA